MSIQKSFINESTVDQAIRSYGRLDALIDLCRDNGLALDFIETAPSDRQIDDALKLTVQNIRPLFAQKPVKKQVKVFVDAGQNMVDLSLQESGSVEGLISFLKNNGYAPDDDPSIGSMVVTPSGDIIDQGVRDFYTGLQWKVNNGIIQHTVEVITVDSTEITVDSTDITIDETTI